MLLLVTLRPVPEETARIALDLPDTGEVARIDAITASRQGNENPFVLDPH
jgi:hypothetical protein